MQKTVDTLKGQILDDLRSLDKKREGLKAELDLLDRKEQQLKTVLAYIASKSQGEAPGNGTAIPPISFENTRNMVQRIGRIGQAIGPEVRYVQAAGILVSAGVTKGKMLHVKTAVYRAMRDSDEWEYSRPGFFLYKPHTGYTEQEKVA